MLIFKFSVKMLIMKDSLEVLQWRYAVKKFDETKILTEEKILILKNAFNLTATSYGLQPIKLVLINKKALQKQLVPYSYNQQQVAQASHVLVFCIETQIDEHYITEYFSRVHQIRKTGDEILAPFKNQLINLFSSKNIEEIKVWATNQAYLALGNILTVCAFEQIDSCPMEGFISEKYDAFLGLDKKHLKSVLVLPVGYRAADDQFSEFKKVRKTLENSIIHL